MIPADELMKAINIARKYDVEKFYLIGSANDKNVEEPNDYDFAVKGVPSGSFFKFYGELFGALSKDVDLVDLSGEMTKLKGIILEEGRLIYDKSAAQ